jgi:hypothetical protein
MKGIIIYIYYMYTIMYDSNPGGVRAGLCASLIFESSDLYDSEITIPFTTLILRRRLWRSKLSNQPNLHQDPLQQDR